MNILQVARSCFSTLRRSFYRIIRKSRRRYITRTFYHENTPLLPCDLWTEVCKYLKPKDVGRLEAVSKNLGFFIRTDDRIWMQQAIICCPSLGHKYRTTKDKISKELTPNQRLKLTQRYLNSNQCNTWKDVVKYLVRNCCTECGADYYIDHTRISYGMHARKICDLCRSFCSKYIVLSAAQAKKQYKLSTADIKELGKRNRGFRYYYNQLINDYLFEKAIKLKELQKKKMEDAIIEREKLVKNEMLEYESDVEKNNQDFQQVLTNKQGFLYEYLNGVPTRRLTRTIVADYYKERGIKGKKRKREEKERKSKRRRVN